jgi:hypothetical protein
MKMQRSPRKQSAHNLKIRQIERKLTSQGWNVKADLPGYEKPTPIGKSRRVPDIEATKRGHRKIIEVETLCTVNRDRKQQATFRRHAGQKSNTIFNIEIAK